MKKVIETEKAEDFEKIFESFTKASDTNNRPVAIHHIEKQKTFLWIRVYLSTEKDNLTSNDSIILTYVPTGEKLLTKFACYAKKGLDKDGGEFINTYNPEDDTKVLCLMVDSDVLGYNIPTISSLFKNTVYYNHVLLKRSELVFTHNGTDLDYFDSQF